MNIDLTKMRTFICNVMITIANIWREKLQNLKVMICRINIDFYESHVVTTYNHFPSESRNIYTHEMLCSCLSGNDLYKKSERMKEMCRKLKDIFGNSMKFNEKRAKNKPTYIFQ